MAQLAVEMTGDEARYFRALARVEAKQKELENGLRGIKKAGQESTQGLEEGFGAAASSLAKYAAGFVTLTSVINAAKSGYENFLTNTREIATEARKAAGELITLASIQAGGQRAKAVELASRLAVSYGITDRGAAFDVVQTLQSARGGDFAAAMKGAADVFAAAQVGVPVQYGKEAEVFGTSFGMAPGELLRKLFVAGEISPREPETLVKAAPALAFWADKMAGIAASTVLSGAVPREELDTYTKAAGIALSSQAADEFRKSLAKLGAGPELTQFQKLAVLKERGVDTAEELGALGLKEIRETKAMVTLLSGGNLRMMADFMTEIPRRATPDVFAGKRAGIEAELPTAELARKLAISDAAFLQEQAFGATSVAAMEEDYRQSLRGRALKAMGYQQFGPFGMFDAMDARGRSTGFDELKFKMFADPIGEYFGAGPSLGSRLKQTMARLAAEDAGISPSQTGGPMSSTPKGTSINDALFKAVERLNEAAQAMLESSRRLFGGATGVRMGTDK